MQDEQSTTPDAQDVAPVSTDSTPVDTATAPVVDDAAQPQLPPPPSDLAAAGIDPVDRSTITERADDDVDQLEEAVELVPAYAVYDNDELRFVSSADTDESAVIRALNELKGHPHIGGHELIVVKV